MSNEIAERTIKSRNVIEVQNGSLDFILRFAIFVRKERTLCISARFFYRLGYKKTKPTYKQIQAV